MSDVSRRKLLTAGLVTVAGGAGAVAGAATLARRYGLIPPDSGGLYGAGETLTYASQRVLTRHSLAREFTRAQIVGQGIVRRAPQLGRGPGRLPTRGWQRRPDRQAKQGR